MSTVPPRTKGKLMVALSVLSMVMTGYHKSVQAQALVCTPIDFGTHGACSSMSSTVTVTPAGSTTSSPCLTQVSGGKRGNCLLTGMTGLVSVTASAPITLTGPGADMSVDTFRMSAPSLSSPIVSQPAITVSLSVSTPLDFYIGGTLHINAAQLGGSYSGAYVITVNNP
ncbi:MAG: DUF4402 domain-containing protein [Micavibrio sp.]